LRYILEFSRETQQAVAVLQRVPSHMAYNVSIVDARGDVATVEVAPERPAVVSRSNVATNHQRDSDWDAHATRTRTVERKCFLEERLADPAETKDHFVQSFLEPPIYNVEYEQAFGTLYTAAYEPGSGTMEVFWPRERWRH
jgi:predicted choloylglycine hydrolase